MPYEENALSNRQISTYFKHFELLDLTNAEYHYGGAERENEGDPVNQSDCTLRTQFHSETQMNSHPVTRQSVYATVE